MKNTEIWDLMTKDHLKISNLLEDVSNIDEDDFETVIDKFNKFKWELQKHFFTEERAIFVFYRKPDIEINLIPDLLWEHDKILNKLDEVEKKLYEKKKIDFSGFKQMLLKHKNNEEEILYPKLDEGLDESKKEIIVSRIKSVV